MKGQNTEYSFTAVFNKTKRRNSRQVDGSQQHSRLTMNVTDDKVSRRDKVPLINFFSSFFSSNCICLVVTF